MSPDRYQFNVYSQLNNLASNELLYVLDKVANLRVSWDHEDIIKNPYLGKLITTSEGDHKVLINEVSNEIKQDPNLMIILVNDSETNDIVAFGSISEVDRKTLLFDRAYVSPEHRRKGIFYSIIDKVVSIAEEK